MVEHPCEKGLTRACFTAYPKWARQALAYKLIHILLPKPLTMRLPKNLNQPLIPPGIVWTPGDPLPPGTIKPPTTSPAPPETGGAPPLYTPPFTPGPPKGPGGIITPPSVVGSLLKSVTGVISGLPWGGSSSWSKYANIFGVAFNANLAAVDLKIGTVGSPTDNVVLEIWNGVAEYGPTTLIVGGTSTPRAATSLPIFSVNQSWVRFIFPEKPLLTYGSTYCIAFSRTGSADALNYFQVGLCVVGTWPVYYKGSEVQWHVFYDGRIAYRLYGFPL